MKIEKLHIYGFGKFQDEIIDFQLPIHFIQGENEAGKSTIRAFIQAVLFGFPSKRENALRYEPKTGNHYGGYITIRLENGKKATVERQSGKKAAGDVTVYTEEGERFGEEWLKAALGNMDRGIFQGIFCFGLDGLSEIQNLKGEELNKYIYEAGMTGTKHIAQMEKKLDEELSNLFKPKGQKPIINKDIKTLHDKRLHLREWEKQFEQYDRLMEERENVIHQLEEYKRKKKEINHVTERLNRKKYLLQLLTENKDTEKNLESLHSFKDIPLEKEEKWGEYKQKYDEAVKWWENAKITKKQLESENQGAALMWPVFHHLERFSALKERIPVYSKYVEDNNRISYKIDQKQDMLKELKERLGDLYHEDLHASVTTIHAQEELQTIIDKSKEVKERLRLLEQQYQQQDEKATLIQKDYHQNNEKQRSKEERGYSEDVVVQFEEKSSLSPSSNKPVMMLQISIVIFFTLGIWEWLTGQWLMGFVMVGVGVAASILWYMLHQQNNKHSTNSLYWKHKSLLEEDLRLEALVREYEWQLGRENNAKQSLENALEQEQANWLTLQTEFKEWCRTYQFPTIPSIQSAETYFQTVKEWKGLVHDINRLEIESQDILEKMEEIQVETSWLAEQANVSFRTVEETFAVIQHIFEKEEQRYREYKEEEKHWSTVVHQVNLYETLRMEAVDMINQLYRNVGADDKESFFRVLEQKKKYEEWKNKQEWVHSQLMAQMFEGESVEGWMNEIKNDSYTPEEELTMKAEELAELDETEQELNRKLAELNQQRKQIEDGGTYGEELQYFEENKLVFQENTHKWLVRKAARMILRQAKSVYEKERQPEVVQTASSYFSYMTQQGYTRLFAPVGEEKFIVEDNRGQWFEPVELSRGTAEQLYLSLRLALAENYNHSQTLPLIMDDPFVNFDRERQQLAFQLLLQASSHRQILYFTCDTLPKSVQDYGRIHQLV
ncbi:uncharacterized protein YhaN [Salibacterium salarium]|uniref:ATP-binding protein n=1 Tax=Salibacterium salarium TaxID=284579 RepID=UPI002789ECA1|nr:AAA family ATPase [Salibacterium salarium]MDQ0299878.1 uncharacterized protein YhaN [Salibacterium salarium]